MEKGASIKRASAKGTRSKKESVKRPSAKNASAKRKSSKKVAEGKSETLAPVDSVAVKHDRESEYHMQVIDDEPKGAAIAAGTGAAENREATQKVAATTMEGPKDALAAAVSAGMGNDGASKAAAVATVGDAEEIAASSIRLDLTSACLRENIKPVPVSLPVMEIGKSRECNEDSRALFLEDSTEAHVGLKEDATPPAGIWHRSIFDDAAVCGATTIRLFVEPVSIPLDPLIPWASESINAFFKSKRARVLVACNAIAIAALFMLDPGAEYLHGPSNTVVLKRHPVTITTEILLCWPFIIYVASLTNKCLFWQVWQYFDVIVFVAANLARRFAYLYESCILLSRLSELPVALVVSEILWTCLLYFPMIFSLTSMDAWLAKNSVKIVVLLAYLTAIVWQYVHNRFLSNAWLEETTCIWLACNTRRNIFLQATMVVIVFWVKHTWYIISCECLASIRPFYSYELRNARTTDELNKLEQLSGANTLTSERECMGVEEHQCQAQEHQFNAHSPSTVSTAFETASNNESFSFDDPVIYTSDLSISRLGDVDSPKETHAFTFGHELSTVSKVSRFADSVPKISRLTEAVPELTGLSRQRSHRSTLFELAVQVGETHIKLYADEINAELTPLITWSSASIRVFLQSDRARHLVLLDAVVLVALAFAKPGQEKFAGGPSNTTLIKDHPVTLLVQIPLLWFMLSYAVAMTNRSLFWQAWTYFDVAAFAAAAVSQRIVWLHEHFVLLSSIAQLSTIDMAAGVLWTLFVYFPVIGSLAVMDAWFIPKLVKIALLCLYLLCVALDSVHVRFISKSWPDDNLTCLWVACEARKNIYLQVGSVAITFASKGLVYLVRGEEFAFIRPWFECKPLKERT